MVRHRAFKVPAREPIVGTAVMTEVDALDACVSVPVPEGCENVAASVEAPPEIVTGFSAVEDGCIVTA